MRKMNCETVRDLIPICIDEIASKESARAVREHIRKCRACKKYYNSYKINKDEPIVNKKEYLSSLEEKGEDISQIDQQFAVLSKKLKARKRRRNFISLFVLSALAVYVISDTVKFIKNLVDN